MTITRSYYILALIFILVLAYIPDLSAFDHDTAGPLSFEKIKNILNSALPALTLITAGFGWNI